jgi:hypothetical protein
MVLCNFKSANHVRFFQPDNTLNPEEPLFSIEKNVDRVWFSDQDLVLANPGQGRSL